MYIQGCVCKTQRSTANSRQNLNPKQHFSFLKKTLLQAKAFTKLLEKVLSKTLRENSLRRKPVLKEKNNVCFEFQIQNLEITPVVQAASLPEAQVIAWYSLTKYL